MGGVGATSRFVGRADELATLAAVLARAEPAEGGRGAVVTIVGEPGAGKTALAEVATAGRPTLWARAREGGGAPPMWLWEQVLGHSIAGPGGAGGAGVDRFRLFDGVARQVVGAGRGERAVIVLDDLQWADGESLAFVDFFAPDAEQAGIVVVATVRRAEMVRLPRSAIVIELGGLAPAEVAQLLTPAAGAGDVDPDLVAAVWRHTGGNPFFIGELDRLLRSSGRASDTAQWRSIVPEGVRSVLVRRFARLAQPVNATLMAAAELGEAIDAPVVAAAVARPVDDVLDDLAIAASAGLLRATPDGFAFAHSLIREAARVELTPRERRVFNRRAADALIEQDGEHAAGQIALHLSATGDPQAAVWAERAGEAAYAASMYAEAAAWFERALDPCPADTVAYRRLRRAEALSRCGRADEAEAELLDIARIARRTGDAELLGRAALGVGSLSGGFEVRQLDPAQQALLAEAIEALSDSLHDALAAQLMARLSVARSLEGDHDQRAALAERALTIARDSGDDAAIGAALGAWCDAHAGPDSVDARAIAAAEMLVAAHRCGDVELELLARRLALVAALEAGDVGLVRRNADAFETLADRLRLPQFTWYGRLVAGMLAHLEGDLDRAAELAAEAAALGRQAGSRNAQMLADGALAPAVDRERGDPTYFDRLIRINSNLPEATRGHDLAAPFHLYNVGYGATREEVASGLSGWAQMWRLTGPHDGLRLYLGFHLARGAAFVGDDELIAETEAALEPHATRFALDGTGSVCYGPVSAALGALAAARGDDALAAARYREAIAACRRIGAPLLRERFEAELAAVGRATEGEGSSGVRRGTLRREGDVWWVRFGGAETRVKHTKGVADLAVLLARPEQDVHVFDLVGASGADRSDAGAVIDAAAKAAYEQRILRLTEQIEAAEDRGQDGRAAALDEERSELIAHLAGALGLGGRPRVAGSDVERARKAVGMRVRDACRRIEAELPELGRHLHSAIRTGTWCSYRPESPVEWTL